MFLKTNLEIIRKTIPGVVLAYHFHVKEKNQFVVVERYRIPFIIYLDSTPHTSTYIYILHISFTYTSISFESVAAMFNYGNSEYHMNLVAMFTQLAEEPIEAKTDVGESNELEEFRKTDQSKHFDL